MKAYVITTGIAFALILVAHVLRMMAEGVQIVFEPAFALSSAASAAIVIWAIRLLRKRGS